MDNKGVFTKDYDASSSLANEKILYTYQLSPCISSYSYMSRYLTQAILLEVCTYPKPGLVTRMGNGSHEDMSLLTFMMSSAVIGEAFRNLQDMAMCYDGNLQELWLKIREYGIKAEKELMKTTGGVNTQRGILFAGGILCAAAGVAVRNNRSLFKGIETILDIEKDLTSGIVEKELRKKQSRRITAGEILFQKYGITGIRGEVEHGFPSVVEKGLPAIKEAFARGCSLNDALVHTLLALMTTVEDSNIIWRSNIETLGEVRCDAANILNSGSIFTRSGRELLHNIVLKYKKRNISPGGSADLLSVTIAFYLLENSKFPVPII